MAVVFAYLSDSKAWMRMALLASALPLAILANAIRVAVAASAPSLDSGTPHALLGWFLFVLCLLTLMLLRRVFNEVYTRYYA
jgi:exosortase/archaeosortase family protein